MELWEETEMRCKERTIFVLEYIRAYDTHEIGERHADGGEYDAAAFVGYVIIVPNV